MVLFMYFILNCTCWFLSACAQIYSLLSSILGFAPLGTVVLDALMDLGEEGLWGNTGG